MKAVAETLLTGKLQQDNVCMSFTVPEADKSSFYVLEVAAKDYNLIEVILQIFLIIFFNPFSVCSTSFWGTKNALQFAEFGLCCDRILLKSSAA